MVTFQSCAVVVSPKLYSEDAVDSYLQSALIAGIESQLLGTVQSTVPTIGHWNGQVLLGLTYLALFSALGATMSSLVLTQELSAIAIRCARKPSHELDLKEYDGRIDELMSKFNDDRHSWKNVLLHRESCSTFCIASVELMRWSPSLVHASHRLCLHHLAARAVCVVC